MSGRERSESDEREAGSAGPESRAASVIGVLGAGTMGAGIAQLACRAGAETLLFDPFPEAIERGRERIEDGLRREAAKGRLGAAEARAAMQRLTTVADLQALADCELVIEAVPERPELKRETYERVSAIVGERCVLATNTSSMLVTAVAAAANGPERVVGMHFFNPAPVMALLEVVAGERSADWALELAEATGRAMGKTVIRATDGPGFLVNRCNRPFGLEALRLLGERLADVETIDRVVRLEGGFRMGPFELMDLVGVDTGFEVSKSFYAQSFGEPRWRPSPISERYVAAGLHGRKSGRGYYDYSGGTGEGGHRPADPPPPQVGGGDGVIVISGAGVLAGELRDAAVAAGYDVRAPHDPLGDAFPSLFIDCDSTPAARAAADEGATMPQGGAHLRLCARAPLAALDPGGSAVGFHVLPPLAETQLVELTRTPSSSPVTAQRAERFFTALGKHVAWVGDAPGLVLGRIVCQVINESAFALGEGVGSAGDIDLGMRLGLSHPRGPMEWADTIGLEHVLCVLEALCEEYREERYRPAPALRRLLREGRPGGAGDSGFHERGG
jgi:3-hydroxybutyryl-CoA dehydrogenase